MNDEHYDFLTALSACAARRLLDLAGGQPAKIGGSSPGRAGWAIAGSALGWALQCEAAYPAVPGASQAAVERRAAAFAGMVIRDVERASGAAGILGAVSA